MSLSRELFKIAQSVKLLEEAGDSADNETVKRYFYEKGALDYRDKIIDILSGVPAHQTALEVFQDLLNVFPDPYSDE